MIKTNKFFNSLIQNFRKEHIRLLESRTKSFHFGKKQFVYREGFAPSGLFIVVKGKVKILKTAYNGKEIIINIARENDFLGYPNLISRTDFRSSAFTLEETTLYFIPKALFYKLAEEYPAFTLRLSKTLALDYDEALEKLTDLTNKQVRRRVAEMLLTLLENFGTDREKQAIQITLSREDLARLVATNTETLVRTLSEFKDEKLISFNGKRISVVNPKKLSRLASNL
jgi:CRP/FNR family transcriptional regulator